ncbi:MAG: TrmH family RNA methyltransferase, partial [Elusimicrobiota bacterium]
GRIAILFGSEKTGLPQEILDKSSHLLVIPTHPACPTMNLAASVAVCCYEFSKAQGSPRKVRGLRDAPIGFKQKENLIGQTLEMFKHVGYLAHLPQAEVCKRLWNLFNQWDVRGRHAALIAGLVRKINRGASQ